MKKLKTPLESLYHWEKTAPEKVYLNQPIKGVWHKYTWKDVGYQARRLAAAIQAQSFPPQSRILIASKNCAEWFISDLAIWMSGHVSVPLYPNLTQQCVQNILDHCQPSMAFIGKLDNYKPYVETIPKKLTRVSFGYREFPDIPNLDTFTAGIKPLKASPKPGLDELATIIYTSGTTAQPKGVMHAFRSLASVGHIASKEMKLSNEKFFSYLPLAHVAERALIESISLHNGGEVYFVESLNTFMKNLQEVRPSIFIGVPRIWEQIQKGILKKIPQSKLQLLLSIPIVSTLFKRKLKKSIGMDRVKFCAIGGAPVAPKLVHWFEAFGIEIREGYGLTENFGFSHFDREQPLQPGSTGTPWPEVQARVEPNGEVQVKSPTNMLGYYKNPQLTLETLPQEGYLRTGDQGRVDDRGCLRLKGRIKEIFKTSNGKYVSPASIEFQLCQNEWVDQACVTGNGMPQPLGLITLSDSAKEKNASELSNVFSRLLKNTNQRLSTFEKLSHLVVLPDTWNDQNGFLTPTLKLKRNQVESTYQEKIPHWQNTRERVFFEKRAH